MTTPAQVFTQIRLQANEDTAAFWSDAEILRHMGDGESLIIQTTGCAEDSSSFVTTGGTREYNLGSTIGTILRLTWDTATIDAIELSQLKDVEGEAYGGVDSTGNPEYYYRWGDKIGFSPIPDSDKTAAIYHYPNSSGIDSTTSATWTMPAKYGQYVTAYALWQMFSKDQQTQEEGAAYYRQWLDNLGTIQHDWNMTKYRGMYPTVNARDPIFVD
jgi:hypothetical protein